MRQHEIRKKLDELYKIELVQKVRSERSLKTSDELYALLSPRSRRRRKYRTVKSAAVTAGERSQTKLPDIHFDERSKRLTYEVLCIYCHTVVLCLFIYFNNIPTCFP